MTLVQPSAQELERKYKESIDALNRGDWPAARRLSAEMGRYLPDHGGVRFVSGVAALQLREVPAAIHQLREATRLTPGRADYHAQLSRALSTGHFFREAQAAADVAMEVGSRDPLVYDTLGVVYSRAGAYADASRAFRKAVEMMPAHANFRFNLATSCLHHGDLDSAEQEYEACIALDETYWRAHLALSQLRKQTPGSNHVNRVQALLARYQEDPDAGLYLNLSLAKEFEDFGDYRNAFLHYTQGKATHGRRIGSSRARDLENHEAIRRYFEDSEVSAAKLGWPSDAPIFVIGMPRSGTTLVDRILSSHTDVHSAGELNNFGVVLQRSTGRPARSLAETIGNLGRNAPDWSAIGKTYLDSTRPGTSGTPRFVDKLPHNFLYAGFIARALPNARIVCLRRNALDTCLSNFRQLFSLEAPNYDYSFDLLDTGYHYVLFDRLMRFWREKMPGRILEIEYERLVDEQESVTRTLLEFCGLSWQDACLRFEDNAAPVATASAVQVRSGLNRASLDRWKRYEPELAALRELLMSEGIRTTD